MKKDIQLLRDELPALAATLIRMYLDQSIPYNADFAEHPDEPRHHKPQWHQWGIISHTDKFLEAFYGQVQEYVDAWGIRDLYTTALSDTIDGIAKADLLPLGILYHDLGKFTARHLSRAQHSTDPAYPDFSFGSHEAASEVLIQKHLKERLHKEGLTDKHIWYIGRCAALHYEIAKIRDHVKHSAEGYSLRFVASDDFAREARLLHIEYADFAVEVGIMYLGDSLAKTSFRLSPTPTNDTERLAHPHIQEIKEQIASQGLVPGHIDCVTHVPVSVAAVERYFALL